MNSTIQLQLLLATFAGWVGREQTSVIDYLVEENRVLNEQIDSSGHRMRLTDNQRRRLAAKGRPLGRRILKRIATIVTPDTILAWHRRLNAAKWNYPRKVVGRPGIMKEIRHLIVEMAEDRDGNIWFGTGSGICRIDGDTVQYY